MKRSCLLLLIFFLFSCASLYPNTDPSWTPYIGCSQEELYRHWGYGGDSSSYTSKYSSIKQTWYHKNVFFPIILPGFSTSGSDVNILLTIEDGEITSISYH